LKAAFENIETLKGNRAYVAYAFERGFFPFKWHYHPEYELTLITSGTGKRLVGDSHENFTAGDLVLCGPHLPHTWSSEPFQHEKAGAVVIQFSEGFIDSLTQFTECDDIRQMLSASTRGLAFNHAASASVAKAIAKLPQQEGVARITSLLKILQKLAGSAYYVLSSEFYSARYRKETENRINKICQFIQDHATENITIDEASALIHLSKSAFCKFFKRTMKTSFSDYVNDIRIANACHQLAETDKTIREIALDCGFESMTYFNRVFARKKGRTPSAFRKNYGIAAQALVS